MSNGINSPYGLKAVESVSGDGATRKMKNYRIAADPVTGATTVGPIYYGDPVKFQPVTNETYVGGGQNIVNALTPGVAGARAAMTPGPFLGTFIGCQYQLPNQARVTESNFWPGNLTVVPGSEIIVYVNDDPNIVFQVQMSTSDNDAAVATLNASSACIFQNWMIGQNAVLLLGGINFVNAGPVTNPVIAGLPTPASNPITGNSVNGRSAVYLDGSSISLNSLGGTIPAPNNNIFVPTQGNPGFDVKIMGLAPSSSRSMASATTTAAFQDLIPGVNMPFCDLLVKFNNHVYGSSGVTGPAYTA